jgi:sorbitol-specific phosphotransferase system component IIC
VKLPISIWIYIILIVVLGLFVDIINLIVKTIKKVIKKNGRPLIHDWCFQDRIPNATFDCVLMFCNTMTLRTPKLRKKNEGRRYYDSCEITTTEYKWTIKKISV